MDDQLKAFMTKSAEATVVDPEAAATNGDAAADADTKRTVVNDA